MQSVSPLGANAELGSGKRERIITMTFASSARPFS
jgi:hypothetical protein